MYKKFGEVQPRGFRIMRADRQVDKQTYSSQCLATLPGRSSKKLQAVTKFLARYGVAVMVNNL